MRFFFDDLERTEKEKAEAMCDESEGLLTIFMIWL